MLLRIAVRLLASALKKDKGLYYAYQANIAMAFYDEFRRQAYCPEVTEALNQHDVNVHTISNDAAKRFLDLFIGQP